MNKNEDSIGIALGGGGALGLAHIGVIKALEEYGLDPAVISGTSAGAIIGGMYCKGIEINKIEEIANSINRIKTLNLFSPKLQKGGIIDDENIINFLEEYMGETRIEDLEKKFVTVSVDINSGDIIYINEGSLVAAIRASISIPGIFLPYKSNGKLYVDGGLRSNLPLKVLDNYDPDHTIGVNVLKNSKISMQSHYSTIELKSEAERNGSPNFIDKINQYMNSEKNNNDNTSIPPLIRSLFNSIQILLAETSQKEIEIVDPELVIDIDVSKFHMWEFWKSEEIINIGYQNTLNNLQNSDFINKLKP